jgi:DNA-binding winged helix-turn-helix (wHTH) protein/Tol biopolymer transport system component
MDSRSQETSKIRFGLFELDTLSGELLKAGTKVRLQEQPFQVLKALLERHGEVVTREELQQRLWPDNTFVGFEFGLATAVRKVRTALGDEATNPRFIETLPKRGFRFIAPVDDGKENVLGPKEQPDPPATPTSPRRWRSQQPLSQGFLGVVALVAIVLGLILFTQGRVEPVERPVRRFSFTPESLMDTQRTRAAISPDGRWIAYVAGGPTPAIWLRPIDREEPRKIEGTDGARDRLFWSPDSKLIGFAADNSLKKVSVQGGPAIVLCELPAPSFIGGTWATDGASIVFSSGPDIPALKKISASGGEPEAFIERLIGDLGPTNMEPHFLPREAPLDAILFTVGVIDRRDVYLWSSDLEAPRMLVEGHSPIFAPPGFIIYQPQVGRPDLWALPFSLNALEVTGEPFPIAQGVIGATVSGDGTLVSVDVVATNQMQLIWRERSGQRVGTIGRPQDIIRYPALSPNGKRVAVDGTEEGSRDLWIHEVGRTIAQRLPVEGASPLYPAWSPDGDLLAYSNRIPYERRLFVRHADGSGEAETLPPDELGVAADWAPDGRKVAYERVSEGGRRDLWLLDRHANNGEGETKPFLATEFHETGPQISHDGGHIAYCSNESGSLELYVREFPTGANRVQVSGNGGCQPRWSHDGKELFYVEGNTLVAIELTSGPEFRIDSEKRLFSDRNLSDIMWTYDVSADGRFVMVDDVPDEITPQRNPAIHVTENWYEEYRNRD